MTAFPSSVLTEVADRIEALAKAASGGPWCVYEGELWKGAPEALAAYDASPDTAPWPYDAGDMGQLFYGDVGRPEDAAWIAAVGPQVGGPLVEWLRGAAKVAARAEARGWQTADQTEAALAFARAFLRTTETTAGSGETGNG